MSKKNAKTPRAVKAESDTDIAMTEQDFWRETNPKIIEAQDRVADEQLRQWRDVETKGHCPAYKFQDGGVVPKLDRAGTSKNGEVSINTHNMALARVFGMNRHAALDKLAEFQVCATDTKGQESLREFNGTLAMIDELAPRDAVESLLISQMVACYGAAMEFLGRARRTDRPDFLATYTNEANKLMNTYNRQMAELGKHRAEANQTVVVKHVNVEAGGQAIVGNVHQGQSPQGGGV